jgi:hypothetical protein
MRPDTRALVWALLGNAVVGFGAGTATLAAFSPTLPVVGSPPFVVRVSIVSVGFAFFFAGYHVTQAGTYRDPDEPLRAAVLPTASGDEPSEPGTPAGQDSGRLDPLALFRGGFIFLGVFGLGAGMRLFALTISSWDPVLGVATGFVCIGGYICGHIGINGVLL